MILRVQQGPRAALSMEQARLKKKPWTRFFAMAKSHYSPCKRVLEGATMGRPRTALGIVEAHEEKKQKTELDHVKKVQCSVTLKRLMVHPDGWPFKKPSNGKVLKEVQDYSDIASKPLLYFETIKWKLEKGLYKKTDQFAGDIRILFCNAILHYPKKHKVHKIAVKLSEFFETKWKSLEDKWDAEQAKEEEEEKPKPLDRVKEVSVGVKACESVTHKAGKKRKFSSEENLCLDSTFYVPSKVSNLNKEKDLIYQRMTPSSDPELSTGEAKKHFLDGILASQSSLLCGKVELQRKKRLKSAKTNYLLGVGDLERKNKEREAARMMVQRAERTVFIDDNLNSFEELERLCGCSLADCRRVNPLKEILGLVLKDEFMMLTHSDEEKFLGRDWEEGEIISFD